MPWYPDRLTPHLSVLPSCPTAGIPPLSIHYYDTIDSTNSELWRWLDRGSPSGTVLIAGCQGAGRGQWHRSWQSEPGGLYLSLGLRLKDLPAAEAQRLNFGTVWGLADRLRELGFVVGLKWPNDLVAQGRKLGGVLIETRLRGQQVSEAVVGVGLNWCNAVPIEAITLQDLEPRQPIPDLETLAAIVLQGLVQGYHRWLDPARSLDRLLPAYLDYCVNIGQTVPIDRNPLSLNQADRPSLDLTPDDLPTQPQPPATLPATEPHKNKITPPQAGHLPGSNTSTPCCNHNSDTSANPNTGTVIGVTPQGCLQVQWGDTIRQYQPGEIQLGYGDRPSSGDNPSGATAPRA